MDEFLLKCDCITVFSLMFLRPIRLIYATRGPRHLKHPTLHPTITVAPLLYHYDTKRTPVAAFEKHYLLGSCWFSVGRIKRGKGWIYVPGTLLLWTRIRVVPVNDLSRVGTCQLGAISCGKRIRSWANPSSFPLRLHEQKMCEPTSEKQNQIFYGGRPKRFQGGGIE